MKGNQYFVAAFVRELKIRNYSPRTVKAYFGAIRQFESFARGRFLFLDEDLIKNFLLLKKEQKCSPKTTNIFLSAIKFFYSEILHKPFDIHIKFAKRESKIPVVLSNSQILQIIRTTQNLKHRLIISLAYASGLRVGEIVNLKIGDIDFHKNIINVRGGKGNKDRQTIFPQKLAEEIQVLINDRPPNQHLFVNPKNKKLTTRTLQKIFKNTAQKAGIVSNVTFHSLRHSFATHLIENGVNLRYVQHLLGHSNIRTTQIYIKVTNLKLKNIKSPL